MLRNLWQTRGSTALSTEAEHPIYFFAPKSAVLTSLLTIRDSELVTGPEHNSRAMGSNPRPLYLLRAGQSWYDKKHKND